MQRFERGVRPVVSRIEVAAIERDQRAGGFEDRVRLIRERLMAGGQKSRSQPPYRLELADQDSRGGRGGLADLIECELGETFEPHGRHPYPEPAAGVVPVAFERGPLSERQQRVGEPVDARNAGERVVDRGRQRADRDLNNLRDSELAILGERAVTADVNPAIDRGFERAGLVRRDNCCERLAAEHELAARAEIIRMAFALRTTCTTKSRSSVFGEPNGGFPGFAVTPGIRYAKEGIEEHLTCLLEAHAVLAQIRRGLCGVPFESLAMENVTDLHAESVYTS